jgi:hypothetical protein
MLLVQVASTPFKLVSDVHYAIDTSHNSTLGFG